MNISYYLPFRVARCVNESDTPNERLGSADLDRCLLPSRYVWAATNVVSRFANSDLEALIAAAYGVPQIAPGLLDRAYD